MELPWLAKASGSCTSRWLSKRERPDLSSCYDKSNARCPTWSFVEMDKRWRRPPSLLSLLLAGQFHERLGRAHESLPILLHVLGGAALVGDMHRDRGSGHHVNGIPWAPALAQGTADASFQIDIAKGLKARLILPGNFIDAVHRADFNTGFAARAVV